MRRRLGLLATLAALLSPLPARADPTAQLARHLDGDVAVAIRLDFAQLEEAVELYRTSKQPGAQQTVFLASAAATAWLGFDPLTQNGWIAGGFDPAAPILFGLAAIDEGGATARFEAGISPPRTRAPQVLWRNRIVAATADPHRAAATLRKLAELLPDLHRVADADATALCRALGATGDPHAVVTALQRAGVVVAGRLPWLNLLLFARVDQQVAIIDLFAGFATPARWPADGQTILGLLTRRPSPSLAKRLSTGAATRLGQPGTTLWIEPRRLLVAREALRQSSELVARQHDPGAPAPTARPQRCRDFDTIAETGPFTDLAWTLRIVPRRSAPSRRGPQIELSATWGLRQAYRLAAAILVEDDGLLDPGDAVAHHGAVAAGVVHLRNLNGLRSLPRPQLLERSHQELVLALDQCGNAAVVVLFGFGWPQLLGAKLDDIASIDPEAATLVDATRNSAFAIKAVGPQLRTMIAAGAMSFDPTARPLIEKYFGVVFGVEQPQALDSRRYTTWGKGRIRPFHWPDRAHPIFGAGVDPAAVPWYLSFDRPHPKSSPAILELVADPGQILSQLAGNPDPALAAAASRLAPYAATLTRFRATLELSGGRLEAISLWQLQ